MRQWSVPAEVSDAPRVDSPVGTTPVALAPSGRGLAMMVNIPQDDRLPHIDNRLGVMTYDGIRWEVAGTMAGSGRHWPASLIALGNEIHLFWAGHLPEEQEAFERGEIYSTEVYHCVFVNELCRNKKSFRASDHGVFLADMFGTPVASQGGTVHVTSFANAGKHVSIGTDGRIRLEEDLGARSYPNISLDGRDIVLAFSGPPAPGRNHIIYMERFYGTSWSPMQEIFWGGQDWDAHYPRLRVDDSGVYHLAVFGRSRLGQTRLLYTWSEDRGDTWAPPELVFKHDRMFFRGPEILFTTDDVHVVWRHPGDAVGMNRVGIENYLSSRVGGEWSVSDQLFTEVQPTSEAHFAVDSDDVIHAVWTHFNVMYHATYR